MTRHPSSLIYSVVINIIRLPIQTILYFLEKIYDGFDFIDSKIRNKNQNSQYTRKGHCIGAGHCCQDIGIPTPNWILKNPILKKTLTLWHKLRFNFEPKGQSDTMLLYRCNYLTTEKRCHIYRFRPKLCRDYPAILWNGKPTIHKGCGYSFERRSKKKIDQLLEDARNFDV